MKSYLILGLGRFGKSVAMALAEQGHDVMGVDRNEHTVQELSDILTHVVTAECSNDEFLRSIGVKNFSAAVVAIGSDIQSSIMTTVVLKELGAKYVIAKAQNDLHAKVLYKVGADRVIFPERDMGIRVASNLVSNNIIDVIELSPEYSIIETAIPVNWVGRSIGELAIRSRYRVNIIAIRKGNDLNVTPQADTRFELNDIIAVMGRNPDLRVLRSIK
jgi:trk system potassium uptake protein TrkA